MEIECIYQNDQAWKDITLGYQEQETIGSWGGLLTCMVMALNIAGYDETPLTLNDKLKDIDGYIGALPLPAKLPFVFDKIFYQGYEPYDDCPAPLDRIDAALDLEQPVIVQVDWNPKSNIFAHWVILKERSGDDYLICDPFRYKGDHPDNEILLTQRYRFRGNDPAEVITGVLWLEIEEDDQAPTEVVPQDEFGTNGLVTANNLDSSQYEPKTEDSNKIREIPATSDKLLLVPTVDGVAFRDSPVIKVQTQIRRLKAADLLISLEPTDRVIDKIGEQGQWIHVQDENGESGYVAAWYVQIKR